MANLVEKMLILKGESINNLPEELFWYIFKYLNNEEIFDFGQCSIKMKAIVIRYVRHPLSTVMESIRTKRRVIYGISTNYDDASGLLVFECAHKCNSFKCECQIYFQRMDLTVTNPAFCQMCITISDKIYCIEHLTLLDMFFSLSLCNKCSFRGWYCDDCDRGLEL